MTYPSFHDRSGRTNPGRPGCTWNIFQPCRAGCLRVLLSEGSTKPKGEVEKPNKSTNPNRKPFLWFVALSFPQGVLQMKKPSSLDIFRPFSMRHHQFLGRSNASKIGMFLVPVLAAWNRNRLQPSVHGPRQEMGISVANSAITTLFAAAMLFACGFYFFFQCPDWKQSHQIAK